MSESADQNSEPKNPTVAFEPRDVSVRGLVWFAVGLAIFIAVSIAVVFGVFGHYSSVRDRQTQSQYPVAEAAREAIQKSDPAGPLPPSPRLEAVVPLPAGRPAGRIFPPDANGQHDVGRIRPGAAQELYESEEKILNSWQWADEGHSAARIPIIEAMSRILKNPGDVLKARPGSKAPRAESTAPPRETNSGRPVGGEPK